jgi:hypothetical protein
VTADGVRETLTVPLHDDLDVGTLRAIFRQASRYVPQDELMPYFYADKPRDSSASLR